jgi:hypothetical protein
VTVVMNDDDYAILEHAVDWVRLHAGIDAPQYPEISTLLHVVTKMSPRREPAVSSADWIALLDEEIVRLRARASTPILPSANQLRRHKVPITPGNGWAKPPSSSMG